MVVSLRQPEADVTCLCSNMQILPCVRAHDVTCTEGVTLLEGIVVFQQADVAFMKLRCAVNQIAHLISLFRVQTSEKA